MRFLFTDLVSVGTALAMAATGNAVKRTSQYEAAKKAEENYSNAKNKFDDYLDQLKGQYASQLSGTPTAQDLANKDYLSTKSTETLKKQADDLNRANAIQLNRLGVQGGVGEGALATKAGTRVSGDVAAKLADYLAQLDAEIANATASRQDNAQSVIANAQAQKEAALMQYQQQVDSTKDALDSSEINFVTGNQRGLPGVAAQTFLPSFIAGAANMVQGGDFATGLNAAGQPVGQDIYSMMRKAGFNQALSPLGLDVSMFARPDATQPGQAIPKYETDLFGNKRISGYTEAPLTQREQLNYQNKTAGKDSAIYNKALTTYQATLKGKTSNAIDWNEVDNIYQQLISRGNQPAATGTSANTKPGDTVIVEKDGKQFRLPKSQLSEALKQGYRKVK